MNKQSAPVKPWGRGRILTALAGIALAGIGLIVGFALAIHSVAVRPDTTETTTTPTHDLPDDQGQRRDLLAAEPMLHVSGSESTQGVPAATPGPVIEIPNSTEIGPSKVASGFPHTPEGAIGQLAAIEVAVLMEMSIGRTNEIYQAWTTDGVGPVDQWRMTENVQAFLAGGNMGQTKDPWVQISVIPVAAQVKATDGPDWTIACVLADFTTIITTQARMAYGYCERMEWDDGRWLIAPGTPPADAPSTWPGTDLAFQAGWQTWTTTTR